jgi:adenylosuccinate synthase
MTVTIVGAQLGDEGKGALVDRWGGPPDVVVRFQGGDNAGHTVVNDGQEYKLSLVPSGAVRGKTGVLGNGCVVNPRTLFSEVDGLRDRGLNPNVRVARRAHVIMPYHRVLDSAEEGEKEDDDLEAGTTGRGIGPTYEDKAGRRGVRVGDLLDPGVLRDRLEYVLPRTRLLAEEVYGLDLDGAETPDLPVDLADAFDLDWLHTKFAEYGRRLRGEEMTVDCGSYLVERHAAGDRILFEGAQGTSLDIDHGGYPYVTSSNPTAGGAAVGSGVGPGVVGQGEVVGIVKAYLSKVGTGPMPTEIDGPLADEVRERGGEFGTVTGRPRRIGWLDLPMLRHASRASGFTGVAVNHLDVLAGLDELRVAEAYEVDGERVAVPPATAEQWAACEPVYREFTPWPEFDGRAAASEGIEALPAAARDYLDHLSETVDAPVYAVGVGPDRAETVEVADPWSDG